jgi:hypothetical protein
MTERTMTAKNQKPNLRPKILSASLLIWGISGFYLLAMIWSLLSATGTYGTHEIQPWLAPAVTGVTVVYGILMLLLWRHEERRTTT